MHQDEAAELKRRSRRPRLGGRSAWSFSILLMLVAATSASLVISLYHRAQSRLTAQTQFSEFAEETYVLKALGWQVLAGSTTLTPDDIRRMLDEVKDDLRQARSTLRTSIGPSDARLNWILDTLATYETAVSDQITAAQAGDGERARAIAEGQVEPLLERLEPEIERAMDSYLHTATQAKRFADYGAVLILTLAALLTSTMLWQRNRAREGARKVELERAAEAKYRALVEQAPVIVYEWEFGDPGRWRYVSPRIESLLGHPADEYFANPDLWFDQVHEDDREAVLAAEVKAQSAGRGERIEYRMRHRRGAVVWVQDEAIVVRDASGQPYYRGILADITAQKEAEQALESLNADLERRIEARTTDLLTANEELVKARDEAESASHAKSEFLSRASHELRTPMNAILGFGQLLEMSELSDRDRERLAHLLRGGRRLLRLINDILDISKVQGGDLSLSLEPVSVPEVVSHAVASIRPAAETAGIDLVVRTSSEEFVLADRQQLLHVLSELISNGVAFNGPGGDVSISWSHAEGRMCIRVVDTGSGIPPADLAGVFAVFEHAGPRVSDDEEGTGLGLPLCKALVEAMGGTIALESEVGRGTSVSLEFRSSNAPAPSASPLAAVSSRSLRNLTILYVEDNPLNHVLIQRSCRIDPTSG
ncbi:MAG TPA: ATP-binding protein [Actinomycetota bacterium]|nr:ATP-binding protein [Actinomycetota bacterium]